MAGVCEHRLCYRMPFLLFNWLVVSKTQAHDLSADLLISDDDSEDEKAVEGRHTVTETTTTAMRHSPATRPRSPSSSNSGSSSSESEDESSSGSDSDSESSSSDNASPSPSPLQKERKWCLAPFFSAAAVQKTKASPGSASQNNKYHPKPGIISSNSSNREAVSAPRNSPSKLLECGDSSNGFDTRDFSDTEQQGFDPGGGLNDLDQVEKNKPNGLIKLKVKVPSKTISKGKSPGKASTSKSNVKSAANKSGKKMSSIKKSSVEKAAEGGCGSKTTPVKGKTKDSKGKTNKQTTKSHEKKTDVKPKTPKQSTPRSDKPSTPKQSDKKSKKPTASSTKGEKYYKSKAFVSDDSDSDSDASIDVVNTSSPDKSLQNTSIKSLSSSSSSSLTMTPSHTKCSKSTTPSKTKTKDKSSSGKKSSEKAKVEINTGLKVVISEIGKDVALPEPLLSPIQNEDFRHMPTLTPTKPFLSSSACQQLSKIEYVNGIPSLVVKLDLSLIAKVPTKVSVKKEIEESTSFSGNPPIITSSAVEEKPPKLKKIPKRKQEQRKDDKPDCATETKKIKKEHDIISKSPTIEKPEPENKEIGVKAEDSHEWDRKHPRRLSERRSSNTSIQSTNSVKKEKDSPPRKKTKRDHSIGDTKHDNKLKRRDWDTPEIRTITSESPKAVGLTSAHQSNGHKAGNDWSAIAGGVHLDGPERRHQERKPIKTEFDETQYPADHYCAEAKELKHAADVQVDKIAKALTYVDAVLSFIKCSNAIETDSESRSSPFNMYSETSDLIKYIMRYTVNHGLDTGGIDKKLAVLCMRCQALLCNKMFKLKKDNAMKFSKILTDHFKTPTKPTNAQAPSPYQPNWNANFVESGFFIQGYLTYILHDVQDKPK
ncbi:uncharacterized protein LOC100366978 [Saccoglossus kowalevskii]